MTTGKRLDFHGFGSREPSFRQSFFVLPILAEVGVVSLRYSVLATFFAEIAQFPDVNSNSLVCGCIFSSLTEATLRRSSE